MLPTFLLWLHLRLDSQDNIHKIITNTTQLFLHHLLTSDDFATEPQLLVFIERHINNNNVLNLFHPQQHPALLDAARSHTVGYATLTHDIESIGYYAEFLGKTYPRVRKLLGKLSTGTKYMQQAHVALFIQDHIRTLDYVHQIVHALRARQPVIDARIARWLTLGNLAETTETLRVFGYNELQPFLELGLRYTFFPLAIQRVQRLRITLTPLPNNLYDLYGPEARQAIDAPPEPGTVADDLLFLDQDHLTMVSLVYPNSDRANQHRHGMLVCRPLDPVLSVYLYFFYRYCQGPRTSRIHQRQLRTNTTPLFCQSRGGHWKYLHRHVTDYARQIHIPCLAQMGLLGATSSYVHQSRIMWLASRGLRDVDQIAVDARATHMGFGADDPRYTGLASLRHTVRARIRFGNTAAHAPAPAPAPALALAPLSDDIRPIHLQMQHRYGVETIVSSEHLDCDGTWQDIDTVEGIHAPGILTHLRKPATTHVITRSVTQKRNGDRTEMVHAPDTNDADTSIPPDLS